MNWSWLGRYRYGANEYSLISLLYFYMNIRCYFINLTTYYKNPPLIRAVIYSHWQFQQVFNRLTIRTELDFKSGYFFGMCSVVNNLVMSLEFQPIRCATTLFHLGRTRNGYVATRIILFSCTTSAPAKVRRELVETWNGLEKSLVSFPTVDLIDAVISHM